MECCEIVNDKVNDEVDKVNDEVDKVNDEVDKMMLSVYTYGNDKPRYYCKECWREWYRNGSYPKQKENYYHRCGKPHRSSVEKRLCWPDCWHEVSSKS